MKPEKHTPAQCVEKLRRADIPLGQKAAIAEVLTVLEVSEQNLLSMAPSVWGRRAH
ncbi:MAG: hypothetical protein ACJATT_005423 [Myxococcota bacterium]|jgi:hypothetical protein